MKSVMTYIVQYYHYFSGLESEALDIKRLSNLCAFLVEMQEMEDIYVEMAEALVGWIVAKITELQARFSQ